MGLFKKGNGEPASGTPQKSARPDRYTYVPVMNDFELPLDMAPEKKDRKGLKIAGLAGVMVLVAAGAAYGGMSYYYSNRFFQGTTINGLDCSRKTAYEAEQLIAAEVEDYSIKVSARKLASQTIDGAKINYKYAPDGEVLKILKSQKPYEWIKGYFQNTSYNISTRATFDKKLLEEEVKSLDAAKEENQEAPENAFVAYKNDQFEIIPETEGTELLVKNAYKALDEAISSESTSIDLSDTPDVYATAELTQDSPVLLEEVEAYNNLANASITYDFGDEAVVLDGSTIRTWLEFDEKGQLLQDESSFQQKAAEYVADMAAKRDTVGTDRPFNTTTGRTVYVYSSIYGWQIDQAAETAQLIEDIRSGGQTHREPIYSMTANARGYNDFGNTYIEVDMGYQHMYYYQDGNIIFDSDFVSGLMSDPSRQTPSGVYTLYSKQSPATLRGPMRGDGTYEYETPVTYWMPFNGGIGFHDANWQPYFGGDRYLYGGSHGCINLPYYSAAALYEIIDYGVPIICFY